MLTPSLADSVIALYDIDPQRLEESHLMLTALNNNLGNKARIETYCGLENRRAALRGANYAVNAIQVGFYDPCTITDFEVPKSTGCGRPLPIRWASGASFAHCAPSL